MKSLIFAVLACLLVTGCGLKPPANNAESLRHETESTVHNKLKKGMTQSEVKEIFGRPSRKAVGSATAETWIYAFEDTKFNIANFIPGGAYLFDRAEQDQKDLHILFDNRIVQNFAMNAAGSTTKGALFEAIDSVKKDGAVTRDTEGRGTDTRDTDTLSR